MSVKVGRPDGALTLRAFPSRGPRNFWRIRIGASFPLPLQASPTRPLIVQPSIGSAGVKRWRASGTTLVPAGDADPIRAAGSPSSRTRWSRPTDEGEKHVPAHHQKRNRRPLRRGTAIKVLRDHERPDPHAELAERKSAGPGFARNRSGGAEPQAGAEVEVSRAAVVSLAEIGAPATPAHHFFSKTCSGGAAGASRAERKPARCAPRSGRNARSRGYGERRGTRSGTPSDADRKSTRLNSSHLG